MQSAGRTLSSRLALGQHVSCIQLTLGTTPPRSPLRQPPDFFALGLWKDRRAMGVSRAPAVERAGRRFCQSRPRAPSPDRQAAAPAIKVPRRSGGSGRERLPYSEVTHWVPVASSGTCPRSNITEFSWSACYRGCLSTSVPFSCICMHAANGSAMRAKAKVHVLHSLSTGSKAQQAC